MSISSWVPVRVVLVVWERPARCVCGQEVLENRPLRPGGERRCSRDAHAVLVSRLARMIRTMEGWNILQCTVVEANKIFAIQQCGSICV